jgi:molybdate transport system regulatory protein
VPTTRQSLKLKVWLEGEDGLVTLSDWRVSLLEAVARHGSLVAAARELRVPHRTAWQRVREMEERLGTRLIDASSGGAAGGASHLTPAAEDLVQRFASLRAGLDEQMAERFGTYFGDALKPARERAEPAHRRPPP